MLKNKGLTFKLVFLILTSCATIFITIFGYNYWVSRKIIIRKIQSDAQNFTRLTVSRIEKKLRAVEKLPESLAYYLEATPCYTEENLVHLLYALVQKNPEIHGMTIAFEPYAFDSEDLYHAPHVYRHSGNVRLTYIGDALCHYFHLDWYQIPRELRRPMWSEPYFGNDENESLITTCSVPFYRHIGGKKEFMGVVSADISLSRLTEMVTAIRIGETGYGTLISRNGTILTHSRKELVMHYTLFSFAELTGDRKLRAIGRKMIRGESGFIFLEKGRLPDKPCWMVYAPLPATGWSLSVMYPRDELMADLTDLTRTVIAIAVAGLLFLLAVLLFISNSITRPLRMLADRTKDIATGNLDIAIPVIRDKDEVGTLANTFREMRDALQCHIKELKETTAANERIRSELKIAHDIQMGFLPRRFPAFPERTEIDIYAALEPAREVGGDLYDFFFLDDLHLCFVIGDVSDKGVPAALLMARVLTLIKATAQEIRRPDEILRWLNAEISQDNEDCMFVTVFCGILNISTGEISCTCAGHDDPFHLRAGNGPIPISGEKGPAIGLIEDAVFPMKKITLPPGDTLFLYTDGVTEAMDAADGFFGEARLLESLAGHREESARSLVEHVLGDVKTFAGETAPSDDMTLLALRYIGG
ncbi:serine/threonine protein phosphatase [Desulfonema ishimotonii]|uniref:Serine/threonine protein phosphatase n=1 Tax=Desulfonema ishimotonii TaxID=45657 RepID=A0A401FW11_9BACT|nr:SpoIIE family protein phosphatase [Desulfonema ishimotonii]GBC61172.1 serine/threonine protein phosphatase [Desulfonema ishimotonii]